MDSTGMECFHHCGKSYWTVPEDKTLNLLVERVGKKHVSSLHTTKKLLLLLVWINSLNKHLNSFHRQTTGENLFECQNSLTGNSPLTGKIDSTVLAQSFVPRVILHFKLMTYNWSWNHLGSQPVNLMYLSGKLFFFLIPSFSFLFHDSFLGSEVKHLC